MAGMTLSKLITYILIMLFLGLFIYSMYSSNGFFNKLAKSVFNAESIVGAGPAPEVKATQLPETVIQARDSILSSLDEASKRDTTNCIIPKHLDMSALGDYAGEITQSSGGAIFTILDPKSAGDVRHSSEQKAGLKVCAINPKPFHDCFLKGEPQCASGLLPAHFRTEGVIRISSQDVMPYMVKTLSGEICVFPMEKTWSPSCEPREKGLDDSCIQNVFNALKPCK